MAGKRRSFVSVRVRHMAAAGGPVSFRARIELAGGGRGTVQAVT